MRLHRFHGGLQLPGYKSTAPIERCPLPDRLWLPLLLSDGSTLVPCVEVGQTVARGERLAQPEPAAEGSGAGACLNSPARARVLAIEPQPLPAPAGTIAECIVLQLSADPGAVDRTAADSPDRRDHAGSRTRAELIAQVRTAGILGLGGAAFPTAEKIALPRRTLILNGAECEPYISCDEALLTERAAAVIGGGRLLAEATGAERVVLAIEDSMTGALAAARAAVDGSTGTAVEVIEVPTIYPQGGERQLIQVLLGLEVPRGGLPRDIDVIVHNVGTAAAVWNALAEGEPLLSRIVTVCGRGVARPGNYEVALGTRISDLVEFAGGYTDQAARLLVGGPMMGQALPHDDFPVTAACNCVLVLGEADVRPVQPEQPCIRCGDCADVCPARLMPQLLLQQIRAGRVELAQPLGLFDCIECGCCDQVCPSHIPLVEHYRQAKTALRLRAIEASEAEAARLRFEAREQRLARQAAARAERMATRRQQAASGDAVAAAIARAKARRKPGQEQP